MKQRRNSCIIDFFYGSQEERYKCNSSNCKYINYTFQGISVLNLSIMSQYNSPIGSLEEAINYYQKEQKHFDKKDFFCSKCGKKKISTQTIIISLPKIFFINFKRIGENNFYNHNVHIPDKFNMRDLINDGNYEYELIGLIKHLGDSDSGHNIAICKNFFDSIWYVYDDYQVTQLSNTKHVYYKDNIKHLDTSDGFLFFYKRENCNLEVDKDLIIEKASEIRK
jgi:ubiquitin C-terminal hydrolase